MVFQQTFDDDEVTERIAAISEVRFAGLVQTDVQSSWIFVYVRLNIRCTNRLANFIFADDRSNMQCYER